MGFKLCAQLTYELEPPPPRSQLGKWPELWVMTGYDYARHGLRHFLSGTTHPRLEIGFRDLLKLKYGSRFQLFQVYL